MNARIPSEQRATIISLDALFGDAGSTVGQVGLGWLSQTVSIPFAWLIGGAGARRERAVARRGAAGGPGGARWGPPVTAPAGEPGLEAEAAGCFGPEPAATCVPRGRAAAGDADEQVA